MGKISILSDKFRDALEEELRQVAGITGWGEVTIELRDGKPVLIKTTISRMPTREGPPDPRGTATNVL